MLARSGGVSLNERTLFSRRSNDPRNTQKEGRDVGPRSSILFLVSGPSFPPVYLFHRLRLLSLRHLFPCKINGSTVLFCVQRLTNRQLLKLFFTKIMYVYIL